MARIFVNIASYRDPECQHTIRDLFGKADHPDLIKVGVCWQFDPEMDKDCFQIRTRPAQVREIHVHPRESLGACWARSRAAELWDGEEYVLQIDSHMRFVQGWDRKMIAMLDKCSSSRAVLTTHPLAYTPPDKLSAPALPVVMPKEFDKGGVLKLRAWTLPISARPAEPLRCYLLGAGFVFAPARFWQDVPYDPKLYFHGEEITLSVRAFTHGWDLFAPNDVLLYHNYTPDARPRHWQDNKDWARLNDLSYARVRALLGIAGVTPPPAASDDSEHYGLGTSRTLDQFERESGISFAGKTTVTPTHLQGLPFIRSGEPKKPGKGAEGLEQAREVFENIYTRNAWGSQETRSGLGSTRASTHELRRRIPPLFRLLGISQVVDLGCGDCNWISPIIGLFARYVGIDVVPALVEENRKRFAGLAGVEFQMPALLTDGLPKGDVIIVRDVMPHLPNAMIFRLLRQIKDSGSKYLLATSFVSGANSDVVLGNWRILNLEAPPYALPAPPVVIGEAVAGKTLALWPVADIPDFPEQT
jgi:hypothetical protein